MAFKKSVTVTYQCGHSTIVEYGFARTPSARQCKATEQRIQADFAGGLCGDCQEDSRVWKRTRVSLVDNDGFSCYMIVGERWNGWAKPAFTKAQLRPYLKWQNEQEGYTARFDPARDAVITRWVDDDEDDVWGGEDITVNGRKLHVYAVGAGSWVWSEVRREDK